MLRYAIYDNDGKTFDRFTLRILCKSSEFSKDLDTVKYITRKFGKFYNDYYGFSENPFHPQGFGQSCGEYDTLKSYKHLGKKVNLDTLPEQAQKYVNQILKDYQDN